MLLNALKEMSAHVVDITCITQDILIAVNNALPFDDWWFWLVHLNLIFDFSACKDWLNFFINFVSQLMSHNIR